MIADSASYSANSVNLVADPASYRTGSVKLVVNFSKRFHNSNILSSALTADSAIPCDTNSGTQCANESSDEDCLNDISLEYENVERKGPPLNEKLNFSRFDLEQYKA